MLCVLDEHTLEYLTIVPASRLRSQDVNPDAVAPDTHLRQA